MARENEMQTRPFLYLSVLLDKQCVKAVSVFCASDPWEKKRESKREKGSAPHFGFLRLLLTQLIPCSIKEGTSSKRKEGNFDWPWNSERSHVEGAFLTLGPIHHFHAFCKNDDKNGNNDVTEDGYEERGSKIRNCIDPEDGKKGSTPARRNGTGPEGKIGACYFFHFPPFLSSVRVCASNKKKRLPLLCVRGLWAKEQ